MVVVYPARGMTSRPKPVVYKEAEKDRNWMRDAGLVVLCPVEKEQLKNEPGMIAASKKDMDKYWFQDKAMIREANVLWDMTPHLKSEGVAHEVGYARYFLYKPVVRIFPLGKLPSSSSIAMYEDDFVCDSLEEALEYTLRVHGSWVKRFNWRLRLYRRCFLKAVYYKFLEWFR